MRCTVGSCKQNNYKKLNDNAKPVHFYAFPKDSELQKEWIRFCQGTNAKGEVLSLNMQIQSARICSLHFKQDDFENNLKYKMGFSCRRAPKLKPGTVPTLGKLHNVNHVNNKKPCLMKNSLSERSAAKQKNFTADPLEIEHFSPRKLENLALSIADTITFKSVHVVLDKETALTTTEIRDAESTPATDDSIVIKTEPNNCEEALKFVITDKLDEEIAFAARNSIEVKTEPSISAKDFQFQSISAMTGSLTTPPSETNQKSGEASKIVTKRIGNMNSSRPISAAIVIKPEPSLYKKQITTTDNQGELIIASMMYSSISGEKESEMHYFKTNESSLPNNSLNEMQSLKMEEPVVIKTESCIPEENAIFSIKEVNKKNYPLNVKALVAELEALRQENSDLKLSRNHSEIIIRKLRNQVEDLQCVNAKLENAISRFFGKDQIKKIKNARKLIKK